jgi:hypothetical protein
MGMPDRIRRSGAAELRWGNGGQSRNGFVPSVYERPPSPTLGLVGFPLLRIDSGIGGILVREHGILELLLGPPFPFVFGGDPRFTSLADIEISAPPHPKEFDGLRLVTSVASLGSGRGHGIAHKGSLIALP